MPCCVSPDPRPLIAVLAAGGATRFGGGKLDALLANKPVGQHVLDAVEQAGLPRGLIVVGIDAPRFAMASGWQLLVNPRAAEGLGTSLACAAGQALAQGRALLVVLADMPLVDPVHLARLASVKSTAATGWPNGKAGVPARFSLGMLPQVAGLSGDAGAGGLLSATSGVELFEASGDMLLDVDCAEDLARAEDFLRKRG